VSRRAKGRLVAVTHVPSPKMQDYERTFVDDRPINLSLARTQHAGYQDALRSCGAEIITLDVNADMPDCVFVEDTALVFDELAVMMSPGAESRRREPDGIEPTLLKYRRIERVSLPGTIDGGDVVVSGRRVFVGRSPRTNDVGISSLRDVLAPFGYTVSGISVHGCLHLKTACSALPDGRFLVNAEWIDVSPLPDDALVHVPKSEPWAGDVLVIGESIIVSDAFPETIALLRGYGWNVIPVSVSEFAKAEGGVTCLSLVFTDFSAGSLAA
jgi:dimethylargininase